MYSVFSHAPLASTPTTSSRRCHDARHGQLLFTCRLHIYCSCFYHLSLLLEQNHRTTFGLHSSRLPLEPGWLQLVCSYRHAILLLRSLPMLTGYTRIYSLLSTYGPSYGEDPAILFKQPDYQAGERRDHLEVLDMATCYRGRHWV